MSVTSLRKNLFLSSSLAPTGEQLPLVRKCQLKPLSSFPLPWGHASVKGTKPIYGSQGRDSPTYSPIKKPLEGPTWLTASTMSNRIYLEEHCPKPLYWNSPSCDDPSSTCWGKKRYRGETKFSPLASPPRPPFPFRAASLYLKCQS